MNFDDPIVFPGQPGKSHLHTFFGNTQVDAFSTPQSIATSGNSTCRGGTINRSGYWVPAMIDTKDGSPIVPLESTFYYKTSYNKIPKRTFRPFPPGLRMIAGDARNTAPSGPFYFSCFDANGSAIVEKHEIANCPPGGRPMVMTIHFPQCWDGKNLDSPDHRSHMSYLSEAQVCPATHPVPVPQITFNISYAVTERDAPLRWRLASDTYDPSIPGGRSAHGDWVNGWKREVMETWVTHCLQASKDCGAELLGDGRMMFDD
jgi:hypothetical protein